jgi:hypothetical protein
MFKLFGKNKKDENDYRKEQVYKALKSKFTLCWFHISKTMITHQLEMQLKRGWN